MREPSYLKAVPDDAAAFGMPAWELTEYSTAALAAADAAPGHQRISVDPTADRRALHERGFQHADTVLTAHAERAQLRPLKPLDGHNMSVAAKIVGISRDFELDAALAICRDAYTHGRFQRDAGLPAGAADCRDADRLRRLAAAGHVYGLFAEGALAGFIGHSGNALDLQAVAPAYRGRGLAKYWWRQVILTLLNDGHERVLCAVPAANMPALNLYAAQGFSFRQSRDIYHRIVT